VHPTKRHETRRRTPSRLGERGGSPVPEQRNKCDRGSDPRKEGELRQKKNPWGKSLSNTRTKKGGRPFIEPKDVGDSNILHSRYLGEKEKRRGSLLFQLLEGERGDHLDFKKNETPMRSGQLITKIGLSSTLRRIRHASSSVRNVKRINKFQPGKRSSQPPKSRRRNTPSPKKTASKKKAGQEGSGAMVKSEKRNAGKDGGRRSGNKVEVESQKTKKKMPWIKVVKVVRRTKRVSRGEGPQKLRAERPSTSTKREDLRINFHGKRKFRKLV